jgi:hypothetical protein
MKQPEHHKPKITIDRIRAAQAELAKGKKANNTVVVQGLRDLNEKLENWEQRLNRSLNQQPLCPIQNDQESQQDITELQAGSTGNTTLYSPAIQRKRRIRNVERKRRSLSNG